MRAIFLALVAVLALYGCNPEQRKAAVEGAGKAIGVVTYPDGTINKNADGSPILDGKPDYVTTEVLMAFGEGVLQRTSGGPVDLVTYILTALGGAILGWGGEALRKKKPVQGVAALPLPDMFQQKVG